VQEIHYKQTLPMGKSDCSGIFSASSVLQCQNLKSLLMPPKQRPGDLLSSMVWLKVYWNLLPSFLYLFVLAPKILLF